MLTVFNQNWRTTNLPYSLALMNTVNTGGSFDTSSGAIAQAQRWASAGFRGFGPVMTFRGAGMDGLGGCGCGCNGGCHSQKGMGQVDTSQVDVSTPVDWSTGTSTVSLPAPVQNIMSAFGGLGWPEMIILGAAAYMLFSTFLTTKRAYGSVSKKVRRRRATVRRRRLQEAEEGGGLFGLL